MEIECKIKFEQVNSTKEAMPIDKTIQNYVIGVIFQSTKLFLFSEAVK